jgi:hypothetical protein
LCTLDGQLQRRTGDARLLGRATDEIITAELDLAKREIASTGRKRTLSRDKTSSAARRFGPARKRGSR